MKYCQFTIKYETFTTKYGDFTINYDVSPVNYFAFLFIFCDSPVHSDRQTTKYDLLTVDLVPFIPYHDADTTQNDTSSIESDDFNIQ